MNKIRRHIRISKLSYFIIGGYISSYFFSNLYYRKIDEPPLLLQIYSTLWVSIICFLTIPVIFYYCMMIERFIRILSVNFQINTCICRFVVYSTAVTLVLLQLFSGLIQIVVRISSELYSGSCILRNLNHFEWYIYQLNANCLNFLVLFTIMQIKSLKNANDKNETQVQGTMYDLTQS